jgi:hypothetical protein
MSSTFKVSIPENSFTFQKPIYSKIKNELSSVIEPAYIFKIESADILYHLKTIILENENKSAANNTPNSVLNEAFQYNPKWLVDFLENFINFSKTYFSRNYTVQQLSKVICHNIVENEKMKEDEIGLEYRTGELNIEYSFSPKKITICSGKFVVEWDLKREVMLIDIPVEPEDDIPPVSNTLMSEMGSKTDVNENNEITETVEIKEITDCDIPIDTSADGIPFDTNQSIDMRNLDEEYDEDDTLLIHARYYDKQKVKEARLRAKLAYYKAQKTLSKYQQKYGEYDTDTDVSNTSSDSSDISDTGSESENE